MGPTTRRALAGMMTGAATIAMLAGCSDGGEGNSSDSATTSVADDPSASDGAGSAVSELVLTAADLPAGYQVMPVPKEQLQQTADSMLKASQSSNVKPAKCAQPSALPENLDISKLGMLMASSGGTMLTELVFPSERDLEPMRQAMTGDCSKISGTIDTEGQKVKSTVTYQVVEVPKGKADSVFAVRQNTVAEVGGQKVATTMINGWAIVDGYTVAVTSGGMSAPDKDAFIGLLTKGIDKVAAHS